MTSMNASRKTALVTGATRGIGKGIAIALGETGMRVYFTGRTEKGPLSLEATSREIERVGGKAVSVKVDHENDEEVKALFDRIERECQTLDVLVNNAYKGVQTLIDGREKKFWEMGETPGSHWDLINGVGLRNHYICSVYATRLMRKNGTKGVIVNVSSWGGLSPIFDCAYGIGKAALDRMSMDFAADLEGTGIRCLSIWPGVVGTEVFGASENIQESFGNIQWNAESPLYVGRALAALLNNESDLNASNGKIVVPSEIAKRYGIVDTDNRRRLSFRSTRFFVLSALPFLATSKYTWLIPEIHVPWWLIKLTVRPSPRFR